MLPPPAGRKVGGGGRTETTPGSSFLSWPEGAGEEEGNGERGGLEEGRSTQAEGFRQEAGVQLAGVSTLSAQQWPGGGARLVPVLRRSRDTHPGGVSPAQPP